MIITRLKGGMGNQMFQYAMALNVAKRLNTELYIDLCSLLDRSKGDFVYRNYDLSIFNVNDQFIINPKILKSLSRFQSSSITKFFRNRINKNRNYVKENDFHFQSDYVLQAVDNTIFDGWFQSQKYFEDIENLIRKEFTFKQGILPASLDLFHQIQSTNAICLNVRRTDFLKVDTLNTTNKTYFINGAHHLAERIEKPVFYIFSDDVKWCREHLKLDYPSYVVGHEHKGEKFGNYMQLMIACQHFIIPNSSFAWWAVWLNQNKTKQVVAPKKWFNDPSINTNDLVPSDWMRL